MCRLPLVSQHLLLPPCRHLAVTGLIRPLHSISFDHSPSPSPLYDSRYSAITIGPFPNLLPDHHQGRTFHGFWPVGPQVGDYWAFHRSVNLWFVHYPALSQSVIGCRLHLPSSFAPDWFSSRDRAIRSLVINGTRGQRSLWWEVPKPRAPEPLPKSFLQLPPWTQAPHS